MKLDKSDGETTIPPELAKELTSALHEYLRLKKITGEK